MALNIAISFAITGKKVVVVDMDMRKGSMEKRVEVKHQSKGIVSYLMGSETNLDNLIVKNCVYGVDALFVGTIPPNPAELIMRGEMDKLFEELKGM
jgi:Mrp family chromosome partitioning ATPase